MGVIGAGTTGLTMAWHLQREGLAVQILDRVGVAGGSSRGNAGWLTPPLAGPLPEPAILRYGMRAMLDSTSPLHISPRPSPRLAAFLTQFVKNSTRKRWMSSMRHLASINAVAYDALDELEDQGVNVGTCPTDILAVARTERELAHLTEEISHAKTLGLDASIRHLSGTHARAMEPQLSEAIEAGLLIGGQRRFDPAAFCDQIADDFRARGGILREDTPVSAIVDTGQEVILRNAQGECGRFDAVVVATGAWLNELTRPFGVRVPVQSGRGYSFTRAGHETLSMPVYLPAERVVCTPLPNGTRVAGTMELDSPDSAFRPRRVRQIAAAVGPFLRDGITQIADQWCGSRPCAADGLPLVGRTNSRRVFVHGGHGMWGMTQAPATARLLSDLVLGRATSELLAPLNPLR